MSLESAMNFVARMRDDHKLQDEVQSAIVGKDAATATAAFVTLGKAQGFTFSAEDATVVYQRAMALQEQRAASGEMSGADLDRVSGGGNLKREGMPRGRGGSGGGGDVSPPSNPISGSGDFVPGVPKPMPSIIPSFKTGIASY